MSTTTTQPTNSPVVARGYTRTAPPEVAISNMRRAVVYVRVSTDQQVNRDRDGDGFSIPAQRDACYRKAESIGAMVLDEYIDRGESARTSDRPQLQRMLTRLAEQRDIDYVIVHKIDRLARNRADDVAINLAITQAGAQLVSVSENIDDTPSGILLHGIMSSIAEFYSRNLASEIRKGMNQKAKKGTTPGRAPLGYLNVRETDGGRDIRSIAIDSERAPLIKWAFEQYATGDYTLEQLADELTARGLRTRPTPKQPARPLVRRNVQRLLHNKFYIGIVTWGGVEYTGTHEPLVSIETFAAVQAVIAGRSKDSLKEMRHKHFLKGLLHCKRCGSRMLYSKTRGNGGIYEYWMCGGRHAKRTTCDLPSIQSHIIEAKIPALFEPITLSAERVAQVRDELLTAMRDRISSVETETKAQRRRILDLEAERRKLLQAHLAGAVPLDLLREEQDRIGAELANAGAALANMEVDWTTIEANLDNAIQLTTNLQAAYQQCKPESRRKLIRALFKSIDVDTDHLGSQLADPFAALLADDLAASIQRATKNHGTPNRDRGLKEDTLVEAMGLEPTTYGLQSRRSSQLSYAPNLGTTDYLFIARSLKRDVLVADELRRPHPKLGQASDHRPGLESRSNSARACAQRQTLCQPVHTESTHDTGGPRWLI